MKTLVKTLSNKVKTADPILIFEVGTKVLFVPLIICGLILILWHGVINGGFNLASWGL
jgi:hypothetical protein